MVLNLFSFPVKIFVNSLRDHAVKDAISKGLSYLLIPDQCSSLSIAAHLLSFYYAKMVISYLYSAITRLNQF